MIDRQRAIRNTGIGFVCNMYRVHIAEEYDLAGGNQQVRLARKPVARCGLTFRVVLEPAGTLAVLVDLGSSAHLQGVHKWEVGDRTKTAAIEGTGRGAKAGCELHGT